jgi:phosphoribosylanthranilate isomerase
MSFVKICGIQNINEATQAMEAGATAIGLLVGLTHKAEDQIDAVGARKIVNSLPKDFNSVLVTHLLRPDDVADLACIIQVRSVQIHGDMDLESLQKVRKLIPEKVLIKAIHVDDMSAADRALKYAAFVDALLLDTRTFDRLGGTGQVHDWSISKLIVERLAPLPTYLAGGLNPKNVGQAIEAAHPFGVDVNSGVEDQFGKKDRLKMNEFVALAKDALVKRASKFARR